jgi:type IV pilus assembly protein PilQ
MTIGKLVAQKNSNILVIKTKETAQKEQELDMAAVKLKEGLAALVTRVFLINYATLADIERIIKEYVSERGKIQLDERTNSLIVKDTVDSIERIKKIIETLDTQTPQILIEAKIVEANESFAKRMGLERGLTFGYDPVIDTTQRIPTGPGFSFSSAPTGASPSVAGMSIAIYKRLTGLNFTLQMMEQESKGRIISSPRIVTQNKKAATITSSEQTSFRVQQIGTGAALNIATFQNVTADLQLNVTPQVTNDGAISMQITLAKSAFGTRPTADAPPNQTRRNINTNVLVDNGSTVVIGGVYQNSTLETVSGIPFLKDIPLIGWLFRTPYAPESSKNELIVFITPRIMNQEEAGFSERQVNSGTSNSTKEL